MIPVKLEPNNNLRVVSPSRSLSIISEEVIDIATTHLSNIGLSVDFGKNAREMDQDGSSTIKSRVDDLHAAFTDKDCKAILTTIGGFNANELLPHLDFDLIRQNPKIICGYSDVTVLLNAIFTECGLVTYYGPHFSTFGVKHGNEYTHKHFQSCLFSSKELKIKPSNNWSDDEWYINQEKREFYQNEGYQVINHGTAEGILIGGNLDTFNLLQGTRYLPKEKRVILFIEEDDLSGGQMFNEFRRNIVSLLQAFSGRIEGLVIGRFQKNEKINLDRLKYIISTNSIYFGSDTPIIYGLDFGHTLPMITIPIGGEARISTDPVEIVLTNH